MKRSLEIFCQITPRQPTGDLHFLEKKIFSRCPISPHSRYSATDKLLSNFSASSRLANLLINLPKFVFKYKSLTVGFGSVQSGQTHRPRRYEQGFDYGFHFDFEKIFHMIQISTRRRSRIVKKRKLEIIDHDIDLRKTNENKGHFRPRICEQNRSTY